jgi:hypothetical protein
MKTPLIPDTQDVKWLLLNLILELLRSRRGQQIVAKHGISPAKKAYQYLAILILSFFFSNEISYTVLEISNRANLQEFLKITTVPKASDVYRFISSCKPEKITSMTFDLLNLACSHKNRSQRKTIIIDSTAISVDVNWFRKTYTKKSLENLPYKWAYSRSKKYYIGMKLTLAIDKKTLRPLAFILHPGCPSDSVIFSEILENLKKRRILRKMDKILLDRGYYSYANYAVAIQKYKVIPLIIPKKGFSLAKLEKLVPVSLFWFGTKEGKEKITQLTDIMREFKREIKDTEKLAMERGIIELVFKCAKAILSFDELHKYTAKSLEKAIALNVLLLGLIITWKVRGEKDLQMLIIS